MKYGLFLTEKASAFFPIWPVMQNSPHIFSCLRKKSSFPYLYFFMQGDRMRLRLYPRGPGIIQSPYGDGQLVKIPAKERAQLVSLGISGALGFSYIIQRQIQRKKPQISVSVMNHSQQPLIPDAIEQGKIRRFIMSCRNGIACGSQAPMMGKSFTAAMEGSERSGFSGRERSRYGSGIFTLEMTLRSGRGWTRYGICILKGPLYRRKSCQKQWCSSGLQAVMAL